MSGTAEPFVQQRQQLMRRQLSGTTYLSTENTATFATADTLPPRRLLLATSSPPIGGPPEPAAAGNIPPGSSLQQPVQQQPQQGGVFALPPTPSGLVFSPQCGVPLSCDDTTVVVRGGGRAGGRACYSLVMA